MKKITSGIDIEIYLIFIVLIGVSVFNAVYSTVIISRNQDASTKIMTVDVTSLQMLENMNLLVTRSKMYTTNWVYLQNDREDKEKLKILHESEYPQQKGDLMATMTLWDEAAHQDTLKSILKKFDELVVYEKQIMLALVRFDDYKDPVKKFSVEEILETQILPRSAEIISDLNRIITSRRMQADMAHSIMIGSSRNLMWSVLGIAIMIIIVVLLAGFYLSNSIIVPVMKLKNYIQQMGRGEIPEIQLATKRNAVGLMTDAVKTLVDSVESTAQFANSIGDGDFNAEFQPLSKKDKLGNALIQMRNGLLKADEDNKRRNWESSGIAEINQVLRENSNAIEKLSHQLTKSLVQYLDAGCGGFYLMEQNAITNQRRIKLVGGYALPSENKSTLGIGEGFVGEAIRNERVTHIKNIPNGYCKISSGVGEFSAAELLVVPIIHQGTVYGAIEFVSFRNFEAHQVSFMVHVGEIIGSAMAASISNSLTKNLLEETQFQAEQLKLQEEKLRKTNDELSNQGQLLQASKEELKTRNDELKIKAELLQTQNERLEDASGALEIKAKELEMNSKYKSEFLANMSHELRTPLNSVLILAKLLTENKNRSLTEKEIEYARVIHKSGNDLLSLINDILDLSKIEAGKIELVKQSASIRQIKNDMLDLFSPVANEKKIQLQTELHSNLPEDFMTDQFRLEQVLKNLLSNALKFTVENGTVTLRIRQADPKFQFYSEALVSAKNVIEFSVSDTGIGIAKEKQNDIFEAFQQVDGSTSRKYGGTGLGLSISKMLIGMLGGEMKLESEERKGSTFYIFLPLETSQSYNSKEEIAKTQIESAENLHSDLTIQSLSEKIIFDVADDRENLEDKDRVLLIVEDDFNFAKLLVEIAHDKQFKAIVTNQGDIALKYAAQYHPSAILLDMQLPVMDGWTALKKLKEDTDLNKIPVHIMSAVDKGTLALKLGALSYLRKPLDKRDVDNVFIAIEKSIPDTAKNVLVIDQDKLQIEIIKKLIDTKGINCKYKEVETLDHASLVLQSKEKVDCVFIGSASSETWTEIKDFFFRIKNNPRISSTPLVVCHHHELTDEQKKFINKFSESVQASDGSEENISLTLEKFLSQINSSTSRAIPKINVPELSEEILKGKTVLIADDDMRNVYALSNILKDKEMNVIMAGNGSEAIQKLTVNTNVDIVLMDIMMPVMDGYTAISKIRKNAPWKSLPIIALTANALAGTREKCIQAGANEYLSKPVNSEHLINLIEVWLNI